MNSTDIVVNPNAGNILLGQDVYLDNNKKYLLKKVLNVQTTNNTAKNIWSLSVGDNKSYLINFECPLENITNNNDSGIINGFFKLKKGAHNTQPIVSDIIANAQILDGSLNGCVIQCNTSTNDMLKYNVLD